MIIAMLLTAGFAFGQEHELNLKFNGFENQEGSLMIGVYKQANFLQKPSFAKRVEIDGNSVEVNFKNIPEGEYGVSCYQDSNGNSSLDYSSNGMPSEAWGMSTNPILKAPPTWDDVKFDLKTDKTLTIKMQK